MGHSNLIRLYSQYKRNNVWISNEMLFTFFSHKHQSDKIWNEPNQWLPMWHLSVNNLIVFCLRSASKSKNRSSTTSVYCSYWILSSLTTVPWTKPCSPSSVVNFKYSIWPEQSSSMRGPTTTCFFFGQLWQNPNCSKMLTFRIVVKWLEIMIIINFFMIWHE